MSITNSVNMALVKVGKRQWELANYFGRSRASMSLKMCNDSWYGKDLARVADFTGGKLAFVYPDGQIIYIEADDPQPKGESSE